MNSDNSVHVKYNNLQNGNCGGKKETIYEFDMENAGTGVTIIDQNGNGGKPWDGRRRKTILEKKLMLLVLLLLLCLIAVAGVLIVQINSGYGVGSNPDKSHSQRAFDVDAIAHETRPVKDSETSQDKPDCLSQKEDEVCLTPTCITAAAGMLSRMDPSVDPCDDFFKYACGGWTSTHVIPEDQISHGTFNELMDLLAVECQALLEEKSKPEEPDAVTKTKHFYHSCMNETLIDNLGAEPLRRMLRDLGGWPVMNDVEFDEDTWSLEDLEGNIKRIANGNSLFTQKISPDPKQSDQYVISLDQPSLGLGPGSKGLYLQNTTHKNVAAYLEFMIDMATDLRGDGDRETVTREMTLVLEMERKIAENVASLPERRATMEIYNKLPIDNLTAITPSFNWLRYFQVMFGPDIAINGSELVVCHAMSFMEGIQKVLDETPKRTVANYVLWHLVAYAVPMLGKQQRDYQLKFNKVKYGEINDEPRWQTCFGAVNMNLFTPLGYMFINRHFDESSKDTADEMVGDLRANAAKVIMRADWMDNSTKATALEKLARIREEIGYDDLTKNITAINDRFSTIEIHKDKYFENSVGIWQLSFLDMVRTFRQPVETNGKWPTTTVQVNAFYEFARNSIRFPSGILQPPFFVSMGPKSMNYGGIGVVIGHEILHAFDDRGSLFDANGDMRYWWSEESRENFKRKTQCLIDQYSDFTVEQVGMNVKGELTVGENIADNGGLNFAFESYKSWAKRQEEPDIVLPALGLSQDKTFFLNYAQVWCSKTKDEYMKLNLVRNVHPPGEIRVLGSLSNSQYFADTFECPVGSKYNPEKKCKVW